MRGELERALPDVESLDAVAENIPLDAAVADLVTAATAFHWFANDTALGEIHRVLRPTGAFVIVTTDYERSTALQQRLVELRSEAQRTLSTTSGSPNWRKVIHSDARFGFRGEMTFRHEIFLDLDGLFDRLRSNSAIAALGESERDAMFAELVGMVDDRERIDVSQRVRALHYSPEP
jgi:SAM-dependent methyltransferase